MAERTWFYAVDGKQQGPVPDAQLRDLIARGTVRADTLVWSDGMAGWQGAGQIPGLMPSRSAPPPMATTAGGASAGGQVTGDFSTFGLFGRALLNFIGSLLVIPAPWTAAILYGWVVERVRVPGRANLTFTGKPLDIWYVFVILGLCGWAGLVMDYLPILLFPVQFFLYWMVIRWIIANIAEEGRPLGLSFQGSPWAYVGWQIFLVVAAVTVIGWAWVLSAMLRWISANIAGTRRAVVFNGSGWGILWRTLLGVVACVFIIPIPWVIAWLTRWYLSQFAVVERAA